MQYKKNAFKKKKQDRSINKIPSVRLVTYSERFLSDNAFGSARLQGAQRLRRPYVYLFHSSATSSARPYLRWWRAAIEISPLCRYSCLHTQTHTYVRFWRCPRAHECSSCDTYASSVCCTVFGGRVVEQQQRSVSGQCSSVIRSWNVYSFF